jgi:hypothetical protein
MNKSFKKVIIEDVEGSTQYDIWELSLDKKSAGWYFVPKGVSGLDYDNALNSAQNKLSALGLTDLEIKAVIGKQLF